VKTAKAKVFMFDLDCPYCNGLLMSPEGNGSLSWSIYESAPKTATCSECEKVSKVPKRVKGDTIQVEQ
jgi:uncharacterized protein with PIN domain